MRVSLLIVFTISTFLACNNKAQNPESQALYDQVMAVHDEVMPKMRDIRQLTKRLKAVDKTETNEEIQNAISTLSEADETMMDWMAQFKMPKDASVEDELNFLNGQMKSVNEMKSKMLGAINNAQNLLNKLENE